MKKINLNNMGGGMYNNGNGGNTNINMDGNINGNSHRKYSPMVQNQNFNKDNIIRNHN